MVADAISRHGPPAKFLTDNGTAFNQSRRGKTTPLETFLKAKGVVPITGRPYKPTTQGKSERLHQTLQRFLDAHRPIPTPDRLTELVDEFTEYYNTQRPHQALDHPDQTPHHAYQATAKAVPAQPATPATPAPHRRRMSGETRLTAQPDAARWANRTVDSQGRINICHTTIWLGQHHARQIVHVHYDLTTIEVFDNDGVLLASAPAHTPTDNPNPPLRHKPLQSGETQTSRKS